MYACRFILGRDGWRVGSLSLWWSEMAQQYWVSVISIIFHLLSPPAPLHLPVPPIPPPLSSSLCSLLLSLSTLLLSSLCPLPPHFVPFSSLLPFVPSSSPLLPPTLSFLHFPSNLHTPRSTCSAATHVYWAGKTWKLRVPSTAVTAGVSVCSSQQWCQEILSVTWVTYRSLS